MNNIKMNTADRVQLALDRTQLIHSLELLRLVSRKIDSLAWFDTNTAAYDVDEAIIKINAMLERGEA